MARLTIRVLGPFQVALEDEAITTFATDKVRALLAYLVVTPERPHRREALAGLLWPEYPERSARASLRNALVRLRRAIGDYDASPPCLHISSQTMQWNRECDYWLDVADFQALLTIDQPAVEELEEAVGLHRGLFLEGFSMPDSTTFEEWLLFKREELSRQALELRIRLVEAYEARGAYREALSHAWHEVEMEPWHEAGHRQVMRLLALSGQRGAALAQYEVLCQKLADELDVEPAEETTALYQRIRDGDIKPLPISEIRPLDIEARRPAFLDEEPVAVQGPRHIFVGREPELDRLAGFLEATLAGRGQAAFVSGEAGWGKTRLLAEYSCRAQEAHSDLIVASGICTTFTEIGDPYLPFREILRTLSGDVEQGWAAGTVTHAHALRLWRFLPRVVDALVTQGPHLIDTFVPGEALLQRTAAHESADPALLERLQELINRGQARSQEAGIDQGRIFQQVADALRALSREQPLLLILDDLHWADASSVGLLFHLGRHLADSRILILGAYRPEEILRLREGGEHPLGGALAELKRLYGDVWVHLGQDEEGGRGFVDTLLDSEPNRLGESFRARLAHNTNGHPLFTIEILRDMQEQGILYRDESGRWAESPTITGDALPRRVEGVIESRTDRLDPGLRRALVVASVEGEEFTAEVVARVCAVGEADLVGLLSGDLTKEHRLVRASSVRRVGKKRISRYQFGHNLFQQYLYQTLDLVERAYLHEAVADALEKLYQGDTDEIAVHLARHYQEAGRPGKAVTYLKQAGDAAARVYANAEAIAHYSQAIDLARTADVHAEELSDLYTRLGRALELDSQFDRVLTSYEAMEKLARQRGDRAMELASLMARTTIMSVPTAVYDPERAQVLGDRALTLAGVLADRAAEAKILWSLSVAHYFTNRLSPAIDCGERSLALARELGLREQTAQTLNDLGGMIYLYSGRLSQAIQALQQAGDLWRSLGNTPMLADSLSGSCVAHVYAGEYERAIAISEQALQISQEIENLWGQSYSRWAIGDAFRERGEYSRAIEASDECIRLGELAGFLASQTYTRIKLAAVYGDLGLLEQGINLTKAALDLAEMHDFRVHSTLALGVLAHLYVLQGDLPKAQTLIDQGQKDAFRDSWAVFYLPILTADVELTLCRGDYERAVATADDLLDRLRRYGMRSHLPEALYLQGKALLGSGQTDTARACLLEARLEAERLGSRRTLWPILHALAHVENDMVAADAMRHRAREIVRTIANHIRDDALRASFRKQPNVQAVLETVEPE